MNNIYITKNDGFTLIELLMGMALGLIIIWPIYSSFTNQKKSYEYQEQTTEMQQNMRIAVDMLTRDIKNAGYNPTGALDVGTTVGFVPGGCCVAVAVAIDADSIRILSNLDGLVGAGNNDTLGTDEDIAYALNGTTIERNDVAIAENITALTFTYFDEDDNTIATGCCGISGSSLNDIRSVGFSITGRTAKEDKTYTACTTCTTTGINLVGTTEDGMARTRTYNTRVKVRNLAMQ